MNAVLINNRYRILETLGRGGFGETYLVEDLHLPSGRKCVLKQLKPIVQESSIPLWMKERFQREAAILEELGAASSQIPELYAYFSENQQFYLVQEWIKGETLAQKWQREGNLTGEQVKQILTQILPVLDFVHSRKIVHRDIKPENIILQSSNLPVLIDFGALKEAVATTVHNSSNVSAAIGTPGYMASEQAAGRPLYSSDLYSLGLTAIFLLTGKTPQELDIDPQTGEIIWQQYAKDVEPSLVKIIDRAVRFHPRDRFSGAKQMLFALQPSRSHNVNSSVTGATVKVSPAVTAGDRVNFNNTLSYENSTLQNPRKKGSWLGKMFWFLLVTGGLTIGTFAAGFYAVANWWQSRTTPSPQVKVEPIPEPILIPPDEETELPKEEKEAKEPLKIGDLIKKKKDKETKEEQTEPTPEVVIESKPEAKPEAKPEQPEPKSNVELPILTIGTSESQLVSTLGQPNKTDNSRRNNSKLLTYRDVTSDNVNLTYHSDSNGQIKQADVTLNRELSLGTMQETLNTLLGGNATPDAKNKLRNVYNRQTTLQSFRVGNLQGNIQRDTKDRVSISIWESGY